MHHFLTTLSLAAVIALGSNFVTETLPSPGTPPNPESEKTFCEKIVVTDVDQLSEIQCWSKSDYFTTEITNILTKGSTYVQVTLYKNKMIRGRRLNFWLEK